MKPRTLLYVLSLVGVAALDANKVVSQNDQSPAKPEPEKAGKPDAAPDTDSLVDTWVRYAMPGEHHKVLGRMAGNWNLAIKYRMNSEAPVVESEGTCQRKWILGNRFLLEEFDGGSLAMPFQGLAIYGYDSFEKKYTSVWVDTMNTAITTNFGTCADSCELITFVGQHGDPWTGTKRPSRGITRFVDDDKHILELHEPGADGKEFRILEIVYTRRKPIR